MNPNKRRRTINSALLGNVLMRMLHSMSDLSKQWFYNVISNWTMTILPSCKYWQDHVLTLSLEVVTLIMKCGMKFANYSGTIVDVPVIENEFHPTFYWVSNYLPKLGLNLIFVHKMCPWWQWYESHISSVQLMACHLSTVKPQHQSALIYCESDLKLHNSTFYVTTPDYDKFLTKWGYWCGA